MHLYELLQVSPNSSQSEIEMAYRAKLETIQSSVSHAISKHIDVAYPYRYARDVLSNPSTRRQYDEDPGAFDRLTLPEHLLI